MIKFGIWFIVIAAVLWIYLPIYAIFTNSDPSWGLLVSAIVFGVLGSLSILVGVIIDRYKEYKEDKENNDYRKY